MGPQVVQSNSLHTSCSSKGKQPSSVPVHSGEVEPVSFHGDSSSNEETVRAPSLEVYVAWFIGLCQSRNHGGYITYASRILDNHPNLFLKIPHY